MAEPAVESLVWLDQPIPFRTRNNARVELLPTAITDGHASDPVVAVETGHSFVDRGIEFLLINLLQLAAPPANDAEWAEHWQTPPDPDTLTRWLAPLRGALDLQHPEFPMLQVRGTAERIGKKSHVGKSETEPVGGLLPDTPTSEAEKNNEDVFRHRDPGLVLSAAVTGALLYAHIALFPPGGGGYFGLPHGSRSLKFALVADSLWRSLWLNVLNHTDSNLAAERWCASLLRQGGRMAPVDRTTFAWLSPDLAEMAAERGTRRRVLPQQIHRAGIPMQRRYRLDPPCAGRCGLTGMEALVFASYRRWPGGLNYMETGWAPLVVAGREGKKGREILPSRSDGPLRFDDLLDVPIFGGDAPKDAWGLPVLAALGGREAALNVFDPEAASTVSTRLPVSLRATALGGEKVARSLSERTLPLYRLKKEALDAAVGELRSVGMFMNKVNTTLRGAIAAVLGTGGKADATAAQKQQARKLAGHLTDALAARLDAAATELVGRLANGTAGSTLAGEAADPAAPFRQAARDACLALFDEAFPADDASTGSVRIARARRVLRASLSEERGRKRGGRK